MHIIGQPEISNPSPHTNWKLTLTPILNFLLITARIQKWMVMEMENLVKIIHGLKMNGNLINRLIKGWVEKQINNDTHPKF